MKKLKTTWLCCLLLGFVPLASAQPWTLDSCLRYAEVHNKELLANARSISIAGQERKSTLAQLAPEIDGIAKLDHYWRIPVMVFPGELIGEPAGSFVPVRMGTPWMGEYGVEASLRLVDVHTWQQVKLSTLQEQAAKSEYKSLQQSLLKNVRMAFYQVQQQRENLEAANGLYENYQEVHRLLALQFDKGLTDKIALNQSQVLLKEREVALSKAKVALQAAYMDLKFWMGHPLDEPLQIAEDEKLLFVDDAGFNPTLLPGYNSQKLQVDIAQQQYKAARSNLYPSLRLSSSYTQLGFGESIDFITNNDWFAAGFVGLQLRVPLFSLKNMAYAPAKQKLLWEQAGLTFLGYQEEQKKNYLREKMLLEDAWQSVQVQEENAGLAEENERLAMQKIEKGIIDMVQLKQIQQDLYQAQEKLSNARSEFLKHYVEINYLQNSPAY